MDAQALLSAYDEQVRRNPRAAGGGEIVEREPHITRLIGPQGGWGGVIWSDLAGQDVDAVIQEQIERYRSPGGEWEWKHYSYDRPVDLPERLIAAGFQPDQPEALLAGEIAMLDLDARPPEGVEFVPVTDRSGAEALVGMLDGVFGRGVPGMVDHLLAGIAADPPTTAAVAVLAEGAPVAGGRVEFDPGSDFAGLWGAATVPAWRRRGIFRALVAHRAALAARRGYRYLQVDASSESRPILGRLGFIELATTTPYRYSRGG